jgi:hypothetical protein
MMRTALNYFLVFAIAADARTLSCFEYMKSISEQDHTTISENKVSYLHIEKHRRGKK